MSPEDVYNMLLKISEKHRDIFEIETVEHRPDYGDYRITLVPPDFKPAMSETDDSGDMIVADASLSVQGKYHCELREGLVEILAKNPNHGDSIREATFKLKHAIEYTEFD